MKPSGRSVTAPSGGWERPHGSRATVILFVAAALAGCGGSGETRTVTTGAGAAGGPRTTTGPCTSSSRSSSARAAPTTLLLRLTTSAEERAQVARSFDDGIFQKSTAPDADTVIGGDTLDGIYLVDGANRKKYLVGRDAQNLCTCDADLGNGFISVGAPLTLSATFGAPPPDVRAVDVFVPRFGTFKMSRWGSGAAAALVAALLAATAAAQTPPSAPGGEVAVLDLRLPVSDVEFPVSSLDGNVSVTGRRVVLQADVLFAFNSARLGRRARSRIAAAVRELRDRKPRRVRVVGYTDSKGSVAFNLRSRAAVPQP